MGNKSMDTKGYPYETYEKVPIQYGGWSKRERKCIALGRQKTSRGVMELYRIAKGQRGAGRKFWIERWRVGDRSYRRSMPYIV